VKEINAIRFLRMMDQITLKPDEEFVVLNIAIRSDSITCPSINYYPG